MAKLYDVAEAGEYSRPAFGSKGERVAKESKRLASGPAPQAAEEKFDYVPSKTNGRPSRPPEKPAPSSVASAGAGAERQPGPPKSKPKSASSGSTREYPKPTPRPSGSDAKASPFKERDEGMVNYSKRFEGSDHG